MCRFIMKQLKITTEINLTWSEDNNSNNRNTATAAATSKTSNNNM